MSHQNSKKDSQKLVFAKTKSTIATNEISSVPWKVLIVDDESAVHEVTEMSLKGFEFSGRPIQFVNAYSKKEAIALLKVEKHIAVALVDVVMEDDHAGLDLIDYIRNTLNNNLMRIVLRTGQPGQAPEKEVLREYDINDYKEKTELTSSKLYSTIYTSIRSYQDMTALDNNRKGLIQIVHASAELFTTSSVNDFVQGMLQQLVALLYLGDDSLLLKCESIAYNKENNNAVVVAGTGRFAAMVGQNPDRVLDDHVKSLVTDSYEKQKPIILDKEFVGYFRSDDGLDSVMYVRNDFPLTNKDISLIEIFLYNVCAAYENLILKNEIDCTQKDMLFTLGEAIETRSKETGQHVRRVAEYSRLISLGIGLTEHEADIMEIASPLHDFGKIVIPDHILNKPGKLNGEEWELMKQHAQLGEALLGKSDRPIMKTAAIVAGQHHEHWNGNGYPRGLKGEEISIYGRIVAVADVFDALGTTRCYKEAWPMEDILKVLKEARGKQFDPQIIDWVFENLAVMKTVREKFPD